MQRGKITWTKSQGTDIESNTNFKGQYSDLEDYIFDFGPRAYDKFSRTMKDMYCYLGATYSDSCQPVIVTKIPVTLPNQ